MAIPLTPIYRHNRECTACPLRQGCAGAVPAIGPFDAKVMFVGESSGKGEDRFGKPWQFKPGIYLDYCLESVGLSRDEVWLTNCIKCPSDKDTTIEDVSTCASRWLDLEIELVQPGIIVALGLFAARYLTKDPNLTMERSHGIPRIVDGRVILPVYHPASGLHQTRNMRFIQDDFAVLGKLLAGAAPASLIPQDQYPNPIYTEVTNVQEAVALLRQDRYALDTETVEGKVWSIQVSSASGTGYFIPVSIFGRGTELLSLDSVFRIPETSQVITHNYLYDAQFLTIPNPVDTMVAAWLLQLPMGLKELAYRYCGMEMHSYEEYVLPYRKTKALDYLKMTAAFSGEITVPQNPRAKNPKKFVQKLVGWPDPVGIRDWEWDNKLGKLVLKEKNPHNITKKILERIKKSGEAEYDPFKAWYDIDSRERLLVEQVCGVMQDTDLRDAPHEQAVFYSTRDADATFRIWNVLEPMLEETGLTNVFNMECGR